MGSNNDGISTKKPETINEWVDFWFYEIGINVIPVASRLKVVKEGFTWKRWQDEAQPPELIDKWKYGGAFNDGIAVITGSLWRGPNSGKYLSVVDLDNQKAFEEFGLLSDGLVFSSKELGEYTMLEQHDDDTSKGHAYFISEGRPLRNKQADATNSRRRNNNNEPIPALEVKGYRRIVYCTPSVHKNNRPYQIVGTLTPKFLTEQDLERLELHIQSIINRYKLIGFESSSRVNGAGCGSSCSSDSGIDNISKGSHTWITLSKDQIAKTVGLLSPYYVEHSRDFFSLYLSGLACKNSIIVSSGTQILEGIIASAGYPNDEEYSRLQTFKNTYKNLEVRGPDNISGFAGLRDIIKSVRGDSGGDGTDEDEEADKILSQVLETWGVKETSSFCQQESPSNEGSANRRNCRKNHVNACICYN